MSKRQRPSLINMSAKQHQPSPPIDCDGTSTFTTDLKYDTVGAEYIVITSDKIAFGLTEFVVRHSNTLWHQATQLPNDTTPLFYLEEPAIEHSDAVRLLLDILHGYRLPSWDDDAWPSHNLILSTLKLARKHEFATPYALIVSYIHNLVDRRGEKSRHLAGMFRVATLLDDEDLATLCVSRMAEEFSLADIDVANWSPDLVVGLPIAYVWAFIRAVPMRRALGANGSVGVDIAGVENTFRASLRAVKAQEAPLHPGSRL